MTCVGGPTQAGRSISWKGRASAAVLACVAVGLGATVPAEAAAPQPGSAPNMVKAPKPPKGHAVGATRWGALDARDAASALNPSGAWAASRDRGSLFSLTSGYGIRTAWARAVTGKGVTVAVIDTGIAPVAGLDGDHKVMNGPDLSFDSQAPGTRYVDGYGHGTHMAGIIAGRDGGFDAKKPDDSRFAGIAPDAQLLNMKVGAADGGADVSQVIAALDWVAAHRRDNGMNVRVVNLAYGTESVQPWQVDPLARAVENAWKAGLVVVAAAGNDGLDAPSLLMPAVDPHVLAVGAVDDAGTNKHADDAVADFTNGGNATRRPDVLAPGRSVVSLRVPGSYVDTMHPEGLVAGDASHRFFRGSGTSQATAVVSGEVALLLQARPTLTPDQVKALLTSTADPLVAHPNPAQGAGRHRPDGALEHPASARPRLPSRCSVPRAPGRWRRPVAASTCSTPPAARCCPVRSTPSARPGRARPGPRRRRRGPRGQGDPGTDGSGRGRPGARATAQPRAWTGKSFDGSPWDTHTWSDSTWEARGWRNDGWEARSWREESWTARGWREDGWSARGWRSLP